MSGINFHRHPEHGTSYYGHVAGGPGEIGYMPNRATTERPKPAGPIRRKLGETKGHTLYVYRDGEFYDVVPEHGHYYLGKADSDRDALSRWKSHLQAIGVTV